MPDERQLLHEEAYGPTIGELIRRDHGQVASLMEGLWVQKAGRDRRRLLVQVTEALSRHEVAEEEVVHAHLAHGEGRARVVRDARVREEQELKASLLALNRRALIRAGGRGFARRARALAEAVGRHAAAEESEVLPLLELEDETAQRVLANLFEAARHMAPTRPHPHVPANRPALLGLGPALAVMDRARDLLRRALTGPPEPDPGPRPH